MNTLSSDNFTFYAIQNYHTPTFSGMKDFYMDMRRISIINNSLEKYKLDRTYNIGLILNHIVILSNVFGPAAINILFYKVKIDYHSLLKTMLVETNIIVGNETLPLLCNYNLGILPINDQLKEDISNALKD